MKRKCRFTAVLLCAAMLLSFSPASFAAESAEDAAAERAAEAVQDSASENDIGSAAGTDTGSTAGSDAGAGTDTGSGTGTGEGMNDEEGTGNYEYVIPMEHESVFWNEAAQRFLTRDDNKLTLYDTEGRRLTDAYDSLSYMEESGMWMASEGAERILMNNDGEIQEKFEIPEDRHIMSADDGIITVMDLTSEEAAGSWWETYTGDVFIYDEEGNLLGSFSYQEYPTSWQLVNSCIISFQNGRYIFRKDGKRGALDTSGQVVIEPEFEWIDYFSDNGYAVAVKDGKYGLIDKDGNTVIDFVYDNISVEGESSEPCYIIEQDGKWGIMDRNGRIIKEPVISGCEVSRIYAKEGLIKVRGQEGSADGLYGLMNTDGEMILDCLYYEISEPSGERIAVAEDYDRWAFFDYEGNQITDFLYRDAGDFSEGLAFVREDDRSGFIDQDGNFLFAVDAGSIFNVKTVYFSEGLAPVSNTQGGAFYVDRTGRTVMAASPKEDWRSIQAMHSGMAIVSSAAIMHEGSTGVIRYTGPELPQETEPGNAGDMPSGWAAAEVEEAVAFGLVPESLQSGYQNPVTREEFCQLACSLLTVKGIGLPQEDSENPNPFTDSDSESVYALSRLGVIDGRGNGIFDPDAAITRQEAAKLLSNTAGVLGLAHTEIWFEYSDAQEADDWAQPFIQEASNLGVMLGVAEGIFDPLGTYTREQSMITMLRLYRC